MVRLLSQGSDGIFQVALASTILFSPERAPTAGAIAVAFATILLPFTVLGPFVGILLDRWRRRRIVMASNVIRAVLLVVIALLIIHDDVGWLFYLLVLAAFSVNRFLLAGLAASLPHVVSRDLLVTANAISPTCGTLAYLTGLGFGGAVHAASHSDSMVLVVGAACYFLSAILAAWLPNLGPDLEGIDTAVRERLGNVVSDRRDDPALPQPPRAGRCGGRTRWFRSSRRFLGCGIRRRCRGHTVDGKTFRYGQVRHRAWRPRSDDPSLPGHALHPLGRRCHCLRPRHHHPGRKDLRRHHPAASGRRQLTRPRLRPLRRPVQCGVRRRGTTSGSGSPHRRQVVCRARDSLALVSPHRRHSFTSLVSSPVHTRVGLIRGLSTSSQ